jgi:hypothetical protein
MTGFNSKRQAAQPQAEPVAWMYDYMGDDGDLVPDLCTDDYTHTQPDNLAKGAKVTNIRPLYLHPAAPVPAVQSAARTLAAEQALDEGLWFVAETATEAHLQAALRRLTAAVEGEPVALTPLTNEQIWMLATQCTIGGDLHLDKFARAVEQAHGIKKEKP